MDQPPNNVPKDLSCESCGKEFVCEATTGKCWCFEIDLKTETLTKLREDFKNCLCENCLQKINKPQKDAN